MNRTIYIDGYDERLTEAMLVSGLSWSEIAQKTGISRNTLARNHTMMHSGHLARFCAVTGVSADYILGLKKEMEI